MNFLVIDPTNPPAVPGNGEPRQDASPVKEARHDCRHRSQVHGIAPAIEAGDERHRAVTNRHDGAVLENLDESVHPHSTDELRDAALANTILRVQVGSGVHGTAIEGQDDRDEMGICLEPSRYVTGLARFEQYEMRTAWVRGRNARSLANDLDLVIYSARKWMRLALAGNPTVLLLLFVPPNEIVISDAWGEDLRANADRIVSRRCAERFLGYLQAQRAGMLGLRAKHTNRPELVAIHGYDTKFAMHMLRLGVQGVELLTTGRITLPIAEPILSKLREVRRGERTRDEVLAWADELEAELTTLAERSDLPADPDEAWANDWLHRAYTARWAAT